MLCVRACFGPRPAKDLQCRSGLAMPLYKCRYGLAVPPKEFLNARKLALNLWQQPAAGDGFDPAGVPPAGQGGDNVDRCQPAAD